MNSYLKDFLRLSLCILPLLIFRSASAKPNIILCVSDNHSINSFSAYGGIFKDFIPTPNLDRISKNGILFQNAFSTTPTTGPSIASLLTGMHSHDHGFFQNNISFNDSQITLPKVLKDIGYQTGLFGSWELGDRPIGFDHWEILASPSEIYNPEIISQFSSQKIQGHATDIISDRVINWIEKQDSTTNPIFALVLFNGTRKPWIPPVRYLELHDDHFLPEPESLDSNYSERAPPSRYQEMNIHKDLDLNNDFFLNFDKSPKTKSAQSTQSIGQKNIDRMNGEQFSAWKLAWSPKNEAFLGLKLQNKELLRWKYQRFAKNYLRCIRAIDDNIGRIYDTFISQKDKTWKFVYTSNQGNCLGENGWFGSSWAYECSVKVPLLFFETKGVVRKDRKILSLVQIIDLFPTLINAIKNDTEIINLSGLNLNPLMEGEIDELNRKVLYFDHHEFPGQWMVPKYYAIRSKRFKIIHYHQFNEWEFFDLEKDPTEQYNLINKNYYEKEIGDLKELLEDTRENYGLKKIIESMPEDWRRIYRGPSARKEQ